MCSHCLQLSDNSQYKIRDPKLISDDYDPDDVDDTE